MYKPRKRFTFSKKDLFSLIFIGSALTGIYFLASKAQNPLSYLTQASNTTAALSIEPASTTADSSVSVKVFAQVSNPVGFMDLVINFDPNKIRLAEDPSIAVSPFSQKLNLTPAAEANTTGKVSVVAGLSPASKNNPPSGSFPLVALKFNKVSGVTNASISLDSASKIVDMTAQQSTVTTAGASISFATPTPSLSPTPTPTPTPPPVVSPSPTPTPTPTRTPVAVASVVPSPVASANPTSTPSPVSKTSLRITSPVNGSSYKAGNTVKVTATVVGSSRSLVFFYVNGSLKKADFSAPYTYDLKTCSNCSTSSYTIEARTSIKGTTLKDKVIINR